MTLGTVVSTENTYKYHMQVQENVPSRLTTSEQTHHTLPLKQLLKPAARKTLGSAVDSDDSSAHRPVQDSNPPADTGDVGNR